MGVKDRPYVGTWKLNNQGVVRHTPDALVFVNGRQDIPGCQSCSGRIDLQKFITSVSVDPSTQAPSTASITMQIPKHYGDDMFRDGQFLLSTGLEIHIYIRGFFPVSGMLAEMGEAQADGLNKAIMYPYFLVHHGIMTEVSHEYSGGEHTASISTADLLHFWQFQRISTSASIFGARPTNSKVKVSLTGHTLNGQTPYGIIYNLWKDSFGAAGGVEFAMGNSTNAAANSSIASESLWSFAIQYWEQRFAESMMSLRMYGADGSLYNAFEQAYLAGINHSSIQALAKHDFANAGKTDVNFESGVEAVKQARALDFDWTSVRMSDLNEKEALKKDKDGQNLGLNATVIQAFVHDLSSWGSVNMWESEYETKLDIANQVAEKAGYEFFMDVDGDIVFKPPFYNLDTRSSPAYNIRPIDIISCSFREVEPEATTVKGTGGMFTNMVGTGLEGEFGLRAEYLDYRMVAKYGWRQQTFESQYFGDARAMFYSAVNRMDLFNIGVRSGTIQIPIRSELRPGYPVYIQHMDMYGYIQSMSHSVQFGGQCTTTLNLVGLRCKFFAPGEVPTGQKPRIEHLKLGSTVKPKIALQVVGSNGEPHLVGVPNVVMGLDTEAINPLFSVVGADLQNLDTEQGIRSLIRAAMASNRLTYDADNAAAPEEVEGDERLLYGPWKFHSGQGDETTVSVGSLLEQVRGVRTATHNVYDTVDEAVTKINEAEANAAIFYEIVEAAGGPARTDIPDGQETINYLDALNDMRATFNPGANQPGNYRYFSSSIDDPNAQGQRVIEADEGGTEDSKVGSTFYAGGTVALTTPQTVWGLRDGPDGVEWENVTCTHGLSVIMPGGVTTPTATHDIQTLVFAEHKYTKLTKMTYVDRTNGSTFDHDGYSEAVQEMLRTLYVDGDTPEEAWEEAYDTLATSIDVMSPLGLSWEKLEDAAMSDNYSFIAYISMENQARPPAQGVDVLPIYVNFIANNLADAAEIAMGKAQDKINAAYPDGKTLNAGEAVAFEEVNDAFDAALAGYYEAISNLDGNSSTHGSTNSGAKKNVKLIPKEHRWATPVFPVSDHAGYEVVGTYRYGRGLTCGVGGTWEEVMAVDGAEHNNLWAVEEFLRLMRDSDVPKTAEGFYDPVEAARVAEQVGLDVSLVVSEDGTRTIFEENHMNRKAGTTTSSVFKTTVVNAAYSLADMGENITRNVCECKGAQADLFLEAFSGTGNYATMVVGPEQVDDVSQWLSDSMTEAGVSWATSQAALRGEYQETAEGLFSNIFDAAEEALSGEVFRQALAQGKDEIEQEVGTLQDVGDSLEREPQEQTTRSGANTDFEDSV